MKQTSDINNSATNIISFKKYKDLNICCQDIRFYDCPIIKNAGWHLSYFGNEKFIKNKLVIYR